MSGTEVHIAGVLLHVLPTLRSQVASSVKAIPSAEIRGMDATHLVLVLEARNAGEVMDLIDSLRNMPGVLNVSLVYQHVESAAAMEETLDVDHSS